MAMESVTSDIPLGCPVLGVTVKPEGKSVQKEICARGNLSVFFGLMCPSSIMSSPAGLQEILTLLTHYQPFSVSHAQQRRRRIDTANGLEA